MPTDDQILTQCAGQLTARQDQSIASFGERLKKLQQENERLRGALKAATRDAARLASRYSLVLEIATKLSTNTEEQLATLKAFRKATDALIETVGATAETLRQGLAKLVEIKSGEVAS